MPESDRAALHAAGVSAVFGPGVDAAGRGARAPRRGESEARRAAASDNVLFCVHYNLRRIEEDAPQQRRVQAEPGANPNGNSGSFVSVRVVKMRIEFPSTLQARRDGRVPARFLPRVVEVELRY